MHILEMLKPENVRIEPGVSTWEDAVRLAVAPLEEGNYVEPRYADEIIRATHELGPYYVLTEDIALIHGRPEDGTIKGQLAVTLLKEPIKFEPDGFDVRLLVALAAEDAHAHLDVMRVLAGIFMDEEKIATLVQMSSTREIFQAFTEGAE
ncbi:PTS sugar transporter subunit IIA [Collinsella sp. zg1085]|uniref:PTS sugar transporter subunit IIA n=1 Tax=Collinsella sp. zg1085 TaxID=2844380 RepID=UPI001C0AC751|nr:PTS sugar transporter subunit IIA [Collinsella sp. zg1085]QWT17660.1 PTS sugar transporter subunit IIA [Collinsella sp. zg1085]